MDTLEESKKLTSSQLRKIKKPLIEKRRRERINDSLTQLKSLILEALNKDENQYNKMEKADILELTVKHLKNITSQQRRNPSRYPCKSPDGSHDVHVQNSDAHLKNYRAGFVHCVTEVQQYMQKTTNVQQDIKNHLTNHLNARLQDVPKSDQVQSPPPTANGYVQILPKDAMVVGKEALSTVASPHGLQCVQSLPILNGQALVLTSPIQGLQSPTYQPMIQLARPVVTYIPHQQLSNSNNNMNLKPDKLAQPELVAQVSPSSVTYREVSSAQTNKNLVVQPCSDELQTSLTTQPSPTFHNKNSSVMSEDRSHRSRMLVSSHNHSGTLDNMNLVKNTVPRKDFNHNEGLCEGFPLVTEGKASNYPEVLNNNRNVTRHHSEQLVDNRGGLVSSGSIDHMMWRPW